MTICPDHTSDLELHIGPTKQNLGAKEKKGQRDMEHIPSGLFYQKRKFSLTILHVYVTTIVPPIKSGCRV